MPDMKDISISLLIAFVKSYYKSFAAGCSDLIYLVFSTRL